MTLLGCVRHGRPALLSSALCCGVGRTSRLRSPSRITRLACALPRARSRTSERYALTLASPSLASSAAIYATTVRQTPTSSGSIDLLWTCVAWRGACWEWSCCSSTAAARARAGRAGRAGAWTVAHARVGAGGLRLHSARRRMPSAGVWRGKRAELAEVSPAGGGTRVGRPSGPERAGAAQ